MGDSYLQYKVSIENPCNFPASSHVPCAIFASRWCSNPSATSTLLTLWKFAALRTQSLANFNKLPGRGNRGSWRQIRIVAGDFAVFVEVFFLDEGSSATKGGKVGDKGSINTNKFYLFTIYVILSYFECIIFWAKQESLEVLDVGDSPILEYIIFLFRVR